MLQREKQQGQCLLKPTQVYQLWSESLMGGGVERGNPCRIQKSAPVLHKKIHANSIGFHHLVAQGEKTHTLHVKFHTLERIQSKVKFDIIVFVLLSCVCVCTHVCVCVCIQHVCRGQRSMLVSFQIAFPPCTLRQALSLS